MKRMLMTLLTVAGLAIPSLAIQPQAAHADSDATIACKIAAGIFTLGLAIPACDPTPFAGAPGGVAPAALTYSLQNVKVTVTGDQHDYAFDVVPSDGTAAQHYTGSYAPSSKVAHEDYGKAHWDFTCPFDPWTYPTTLVCTQPASLAGSSLAEPAGAQAVEGIDGGPAVLAAALQKAQAAIPPGPKPATQAIFQPVLPASAQTSAPTLPDFQAVGIAGPTSINDGDNAVYTATVRNNGSAANGDVEIEIGFTGGLQAWNNIVQSIGLTCAQALGGAQFTCQGGTLAAGQQATLQFQVHAVSAGQNTIAVAMNPRSTVGESDLSNNGANLVVTVVN